jgi:integrase
MGLSRTFIREHRVPGKYRDEDNLYLVIPARRPAGGSWQLLYSLNGRARTMGLGSRTRDREEARTAAREARALLERGIDPLQARADAALAQQIERARGTTFAEAAERYIAVHAAGWRNAKHGKQWAATLATYAKPVIGNTPVSEISTDQVLAVLEPIWVAKPETAGRVRGRIETVLDFAKARGWRDGENPARWRGHLALMLPAKAKLRPVVHHAALDWREAPAFMARLLRQPGMGAAALAFAIVTAARSGEVRFAAWDEVDLDEAIWTISAERMKARRPHRVPLSDTALAVLERVKASRAIGPLIFPGARAGRPLSDMSLAAVLRRMKNGDLTAHGFRSTFRDWTAEATHYPNHVAEAALAHMVDDKVEAAYRRGDLFDKRRAMLADWATYLAKPLPAAAAAE